MSTPTVTPKQEGNSREGFLADESTGVMIDGDPGSLDAVQLRQGVLVDEAGNQVALVKPNTWY